MQKTAQFDEALVSLYLRLNGYFATGFIVHSPKHIRTEIDILAVRFPLHREPECKFEPCRHLHPSSNATEFLVGEVKGGNNQPQFNHAFKNSQKAIRSVLNRFGAWDDKECDDISPKVESLLNSPDENGSVVFPLIPTSAGVLKIVLFATGLTRQFDGGSTIYGDDIMKYLWSRFQYEKQRSESAKKYNYELWRAYENIVRYFKARCKDPGTVEELKNSVFKEP